MADSVKAVDDLSGMLREKSYPAAERELEELKAYAKEKGHEGDLALWDVTFWRVFSSRVLKMSGVLIWVLAVSCRVPVTTYRCLARGSQHCLLRVLAVVAVRFWLACFDVESGCHAGVCMPLCCAPVL